VEERLAVFVYARAAAAARAALIDALAACSSAPSILLHAAASGFGAAWCSSGSGTSGLTMAGATAVIMLVAAPEATERTLDLGADDGIAVVMCFIDVSSAEVIGAADGPDPGPLLGLGLDHGLQRHPGVPLLSRPFV
jgi:hypothetical protein